MALDMTRSRAAYEANLLGDECYILRPQLIDDGAGGTYPDPDGPLRIGPIACGFTSVSGDEAQADIVEVRGRYRLKLPTTVIDPDTEEEVTPVETDEVEFQGKVYAVIWAPPVTALNLKRKLGLRDT
jgi:hypothetical protein